MRARLAALVGGANDWTGAAADFQVLEKARRMQQVENSTIELPAQGPAYEEASRARPMPVTKSTIPQSSRMRIQYPPIRNSLVGSFIVPLFP